jgi:hypothetical protein
MPRFLSSCRRPCVDVPTAINNQSACNTSVNQSEKFRANICRYPHLWPESQDRLIPTISSSVIQASETIAW